MVFHLDEARARREARLDPDTHALALFPSELDAGRASHKSVAGQMEALSLTDFPSEASAELATRESTADHVAQRNRPVAAGASPAATQAPAWRAMEPRRPRATVVSSRQLLREGHHRSSPHWRVLAGTAHALVFVSVGATLGIFVVVTAFVPATPVFKPNTTLLQRQTTHTIPTEPVAVEQRLSTIGTTPVEHRNPAPPPGARPDGLKPGGALSVVTETAGAAIYVDGQLAGFTSITGWPVDVGSHVVRIELEGYQRWSAVSRIVADETNYLVAKLSPIEQN